MNKFLTQTKGLLRIIRFCFRISLSPLIKESRKYFAMNIITSLFSATLPFLFIYLSSSVIGILAGEGDDGAWRSFVYLCVAVLAVGLLAKALENFKRYCDGMYREILGNHIRILMMEKSASLDVAFFDSPVFYNEMRDATDNAPLIAQTTFQTFDFIRNTAQLLMAVFLMSRFSITFTLLLALSIVPHVIFQRKQLDGLYSFQRGVLGDERKLYYLSEMLFSKEYVKDARLFNLFPFIKAKYDAAWKLIFLNKKKLSFRYTVLLAVSNFLPEMVLVAFMVRMGYGVFGGDYLLSEYSYYYGIAGQVMSCMYMSVYNYAQLMDGRTRIDYYLKFMSWNNKVVDKSEINIDSGASETEPGVGILTDELIASSEVTVEFRDVSFSYGEDLPLVLRNVSFLIRTSQKTAIVGVNGSGKSTIVKLLMRLYDPTAGMILLNGVDIRKYKQEYVHKYFSTMFQDYPSYAFSVRESVSLSDYRKAGDVCKVGKALTKSDANTIVSRFPNGIDTYLTRQYEEDGVELSGGEWQKISAARTFFREAPIMILDEPSAALDAESEDRLFRQLEDEYTDKCIVLISHRLSNVVNANQILVLDDGRLMEQGTHVELMGSSNKYAELFNLQAKKYSQGATCLSDK
ncbi:MAG: ABC transporter ATP-binding protein/permease [Lachnospiraceae bacterium]|jgi:ATP-binding cassette subfamily B protein|nr:ABC transporter ATP-binding protein/permease [Lachnospiraceae bacterium]